MGNLTHILTGTPASSSTQKRFFHLSASQLSWVSRNYRWLMLLIGGLILVVHTLDSLDTSKNVSGLHFYFYLEIFILLILLISVYLLLKWLFSVAEEKNRAIRLLELKNRLHGLLNLGQDIRELLRLIGQEVCALVPETQTELWIYEEQNSWRLRAIRQQEAFVAQKEEAFEWDAAPPCRSCRLAEEGKAQSIKSCMRQKEENLSGPVFCLSLEENNLTLGSILFHLQAGQTLSDWQIQALNILRQEMIQAIRRLLSKRTREEALLTERIRTMQLDIARDLHDTVGQNVGYLRMKLDALVDSPPAKMKDWQEEARQMAAVANESYDLVRGTLNILQSDDSADMVFMFSRYARQVGQRSGFRVDFSTQGTPHTLSPSQMRHVFYIFREALSNIEKHARAHTVCIQVQWGEHTLNLTITDNGEGYDPNRTMKLDVHYGLRFMRERAILLKGALNIQSIVGKGTTVEISLPL